MVTAPGDQLDDGPRAAVGSAPAREVRAWYAYDWACSAFSTTVVAVFLGPYLTTVAEAAAGGADERVHPFGIPVRAGSFFPYVLSLSVFLQVFLLPLVGAQADRAASRKRLLGIFAYVGAFATMGLYLVRGDRYLLGGALFLVANLAFGCALVVYNAYLPDLAGADERDSVSSRGWAFGYLGGGLLLAANLGLYTLRDRFGVAEGTAVRISLLSAGAWWALFTLLPMRGLPDRRRSAAVDSGATSGFAQLRTTLREARGYPQTLAFLAAYLLFNDGIQSVIALSATFGDRELGLSQTTLIVAILVVQIVAFGGALLLGRLARIFGAKRVILASLVVWTLVLATAYVLPAERPLEFFALASVIGLVLGGTQALSRSLFSQLIPPGREAAYFGLYEISERGTSWLGPALFGLSLQLTGSYRVALGSLVVFFVVGFVLLTRVDLRRAIVDAGNQPPARL